MWATVPFLLTMIVALLTITYVPAFTEVSASMSPYDPARSGRVQDLANMVHVASEALSVVREVALVDAAGAPLHDATGKPVKKRIDDCNAIKDELTRGGCQQVFFDVKAAAASPTRPSAPTRPSPTGSSRTSTPPTTPTPRSSS
jgi:hypothetical protein